MFVRPAEGKQILANCLAERTNDTFAAPATRGRGVTIGPVPCGISPTAGYTSKWQERRRCLTGAA
jgi:hypothetical protein